MTEFPKMFTVPPFEMRVVPSSFENAKMIYDIFAGDNAIQRFWMGGTMYPSAEALFGNYARNGARTDMRMYGIYRDGQLLGEIGFANGTSPQNRRGHIGCWVRDSARGNGIMSTLMPEIMRVGFETMGYNVLVIQCDSENRASRRIAEKFGFHLDGILRSEMIWGDGTFRDECRYSKLKSEWEKDKNNA